MSLFGQLFGVPPPSQEEKLDHQAKILAEMHEKIASAAEEIEGIKNLLVKKANGSLYPHLPNAGVKLRDS